MSEHSHRPRIFAIPLAALACLFAFAGVAVAAPADLDATFGSGGIVRQSLNPTKNDFLLGMALQPDGKIVVAGYTYVGANATFAVERFLPGGIPDPTFGTNGLVTPYYGASDNFCYTVALQPHGKIVVAGRLATGNAWRVSRFTEDGAIDTTWNGTGTLTRQPNSLPGEPSSILIQNSTGRVIVGGYVKGSNDDFAIMAFDSNGANAPGFGTLNSTVVTPIGSGDDQIMRLLFQQNGKIVALGTAYGLPNEQVALARYSAGGVLDPAFGVGGKALSVFPVAVTAYAGDLQSNGDIVTAGGIGAGGLGTYAFTRWRADGVLDPAFGTGGLVSLPVVGGGYAVAATVQPGDKIVAAGIVNNSGTQGDFGVARLAADGTPDLGFGASGVATTSVVDGFDLANAVVVQPDGKIVAAGSSEAPTGLPGDNDFALVRYQGVDPAALAVVPVARLTVPAKSKLAHNRLKRFAGTAGPAGSISKVEIAVRRIDKRVLKKHGQCLWLKSARAKFKKVRAVKKRCATQRWLAATGTENWAFKLKKPFSKGSYEIFVRVTLTDGQTQTTFTKQAGNYLKLKLT